MLVFLRLATLVLILGVIPGCAPILGIEDSPGGDSGLLPPDAEPLDPGEFELSGMAPDEVQKGESAAVIAHGASADGERHKQRDDGAGSGAHFVTGTANGGLPSALRIETSRRKLVSLSDEAASGGGSDGVILLHAWGGFDDQVNNPPHLSVRGNAGSDIPPDGGERDTGFTLEVNEFSQAFTTAADGTANVTVPRFLGRNQICAKIDASTPADLGEGVQCITVVSIQ
jgi:hypothetical protein